MKFYDRKKELEILEQLRLQTSHGSKMTVLTGRRRIGKTRLALHFAQKHKYLYFFVSKKSELLLCEEFLEIVKSQFNVPVIGEIKKFSQVFELILQLSKKEQFTLIIDEFQEFYHINPSVYSELQCLWDLNKDDTHLNFICAGSVFSLMHNIFQNSKEPLFGRADRIMKLDAFSAATLSQILNEQSLSAPVDLLNWYAFTGGMPKYVEFLSANCDGSFDGIIKYMIDEYSPFLLEGKHLLIEEFGKEYGVYFSILELISRGKTSRSEIQASLERNVGGLLSRLENDYAVISRIQPITAKPKSRLVKYRIKDLFLRFWFRFIHHNRSAVETKNFTYIRKIVVRDFQTWCGLVLEDLFRDLFIATGHYNRVASYWERKNMNEIDLVAVNDLEKRIVIGEIKMNKDRININTLSKKSGKLLSSFPDYESSFVALSIEDIGEYL